MRRVDHAELVDLAASVADGTPIDWSQAEARTDGDSRRLVSHLRLVERIASLHRSIPEDGAVSDVAAAVADREAIDWDAIEAGIHGEDRRLLRHLRLVESISSVHRTMALEERTAEAERLTEPAIGAAVESEQPSGPRWGQLVLLASIGEGASSEVFRAWDSTLHQEVALKLLHDDGASADTHGRVLDEARRLARVRHRHVVHVYGADEHDGRVGLWMELVRGNSLEEIVKTRGSFGDREAAAIGLDLCTALAAVHQAGLLHRDIKAQNVMREERGRIVLMDFGTGEELAGTNRLVGTPLYLAPEIFRGEKASVQTDIYSAGVLLYYLVTGQFPVTAASMQELARAHANGQRRPVRDLRPDLNEAFVRVIERSLDNDPKRRYASAGELEAALRESIAPLTQPLPLVDSRPVDTPVPVAPRLRARVPFAAVAGLFIAVVGAVALIVWTKYLGERRGTVPASIRTIGVLPMQSAVGTSVPAHYPVALTDELVASLGQVSALTLKSAPPSSTASRELASQLDVDAFLETTLHEGRKHDATTFPSLKVNARLLAAGTLGMVWQGTFERPQGSTLTLQADIAKAVAEAVKVALSPTELGRLNAARQSNPAAEEAYLLGKINIDRYGAGSAALALKAFKRATQLDTSHAKAFAGAGWAQISLGMNGAIPRAEAHDAALADIQQALALDPELGEAHATLGYIAFLFDWDWKAAETSFRRALELNQSSVFNHILYINYLEARGRFDEAVAHAETMKRLDPESAYAVRRHALLLYYKRDYAGAEKAIAQSIKMDPSAAGGPLLQGRVEEALGRYDRSRELKQQALKLSGGGGVPLRIAAIRLEALAGRHDEAQVQLRALQQEAETKGFTVSARDLAYVQLALGNYDLALDLFAQAVTERDPSMVWLRVDPRLDPVRSDPRYRQLLARIGLPTQP